eukprot:jgi/Botrbrau1/1053/Bobra.0076s0019.2
MHLISPLIGVLFALCIGLVLHPDPNNLLHWRGSKHFSFATAASGMAAPVGSWESPITSELITSQSVGLGSPTLGDDGLVYWLEGRPTEGGRTVLVRGRPGGPTEDVTPGVDSGYNIRTRVHEYGGGASLVSGSYAYFANFKDQKWYRQQLQPSIGAPEVLTTVDGYRFANAIADPLRNRLIAVREDHTGEGEAVNTIASISLQDGSSEVLVGGNDFYSSPRLSADGKQLAWVTWKHPNMPWDDTELWVADVAADGTLSGHRKVAGGEDESVMMPLWTPKGLVFISDSSGWWNLYLEEAPGKLLPLSPRKAEFGSPPWVFGIQTFDLLPDNRLLVSYSDPSSPGGTLAILDPSKPGVLQTVPLPYSTFGTFSVRKQGEGVWLALTGATALKPSEVAVLQVADVDGLLSNKPQDWTVLRKATTLEVDEGYVSEPRTIEFPTEDNLTAFLYYYPPKNKDYVLPEGKAPPLLVKIHGGPTSQASTAFSLSIQYWTSRGYAIADVNYGGSTGYGREYRNRLRRNWGVVDVDDVSNAAKYLAEQGLADEARLCISGGSAGGYTTLAALAFRDVFKAGASMFGVADCGLLAAETHKFESRYLDQLIGPYPEMKAVYDKRSPINAIDKFKAPIAFFQGTEDKVVPPNQAEIMYEGLKERGIMTSLVMFEGEQHGFRSAGAIRRTLDGEFYFYGKALNFKASMPTDLEPLQIANVASSI